MHVSLDCCELFLSFLFSLEMFEIILCLTQTVVGFVLGVLVSSVYVFFTGNFPSSRENNEDRLKSDKFWQCSVVLIFIRLMTCFHRGFFFFF